MGRYGNGRSIRSASGWQSRMSVSCRAGTRPPTPNGWSGFLATDQRRPIPQDWRGGCSTPGRGVRARSPEGSGVRARSSRRARHGPRSIGCAKRPLVFPDDADHDALDDDVALIEPQGLHLVVCRLQPDPAAGLAVEPLDRGAFPMDQCDHGLAGVGLVAFLNDDVVAVLDVLVDHRVAAHLQDVAAAAARQELVWDGDRLITRDGFDGRARGDQPGQGELGGTGLALGGDDFDRPALVVRAPDVAFALEIGEVLVNRRERLEAKLAGNFLEAGGVPLLFDVLSDVVQDLAVEPRDLHNRSPKIYRNTNLPEGRPNARMLDNPRRTSLEAM